MIVFYLVAVSLVLLTIVVLVWPLYRHRQQTGIDRRQQNIIIARERLAELKTDLASGKLGNEAFEQQRSELEAMVLDDTSATSTDTDKTTSGHGGQQLMAVLLIALLLPAAAGFLYLILGTPQAIEGVSVAQAPQQNMTPAKIQDMVAKLAAKMAKNPKDPKGWFMLARSYMVMQRYPEAVKALQQVRDLVGDKPEVLVSYADALAMTRGGDLSGDITKMLDQVLEQDPGNVEGLWLSGMAAKQRGDNPNALKYWRRALPLVKQDARALGQLQGMIKEVEGGGTAGSAGVTVTTAETGAANATSSKGATGQPLTPAKLEIKVSLSPALLKKASPDDTVFIYARALQGPPLPLAIVKKKVSDLPLNITLDDSMAMVPSATLSKYPQVRLTARITRSGQAKPASGDFIGEVSPVAVNRTEAVEIVIAAVVP